MPDAMNSPTARELYERWSPLWEKWPELDPVGVWYCPKGRNFYSVEEDREIPSGCDTFRHNNHSEAEDDVAADLICLAAIKWLSPKP